MFKIVCLAMALAMVAMLAVDGRQETSAIVQNGCEYVTADLIPLRRIPPIKPVSDSTDSKEKESRG